MLAYHREIHFQTISLQCRASNRCWWLRISGSPHYRSCRRFADSRLGPLAPRKSHWAWQIAFAAALASWHFLRWQRVGVLCYWLSGPQYPNSPAITSWHWKSAAAKCKSQGWPSNPLAPKSNFPLSKFCCSKYFWWYYHNCCWIVSTLFGVIFPSVVSRFPPNFP